MSENNRAGKIQWGLPLAMLLLAVFVVTVFLGTLYYHREMIFDDSYITYRYAKNLADGFGLTWNPGEAPTEGYTNFLFVVLLAPFIRIGLDPLLAARAISLLAAAGLAALCGWLSRSRAGVSRAGAVLVAAGFIAATRTDLLIMLGLETVLYAFCLFAAFAFTVRYTGTRSNCAAAGMGLGSLLAIMLRPDGVLFPAVTGLVMLCVMPDREKLFRQLAGVWSLTLVLPLAIYFAWKIYYYGDPFPNPFYVKAASGGLIRPAGFWSVLDFAGYHRILILLAIMSLFMRQGAKPEPAARVALSFVVVYLLFYLRVDTLMDEAGRFLYPLVPFVVFAALPALSELIRRAGGISVPEPVRTMIICLLFVSLFYANPCDSVITARRAMLGCSAYPNKNSLMQKEYRIARILSEYDDIGNVRIAMGDVGVMGYYSGAKILDIVGLNDSFIARNRDNQDLVNYFFEEKSDLMLACSNRDNTWFELGHGPLGNLNEWMTDPRWDNYAYIGTVTFSSMYDFQILLRRDYAKYDALSEFLRQRVVDFTHKCFPLPLGRYKPADKDA